ncbi:hypothetical protein AVEN_135908-1 [Araneus ventricosus]|uniref:Uncharacterized protein n=1 Tax=Araneus ventricosus TaxID=182803 RepID=A0A4Y2NFK3_ARAVE|nr:hypothetical protein AVEN_135908-1 [Araneus ventricosus]
MSNLMAYISQTFIPSSAMSEDGRSRSTLSSASTSCPPVFDRGQFAPYSRQSNKKGDSPINCTESWVKQYLQLPRSDARTCQEIFRREQITDVNQEYSQKCH